jgi:hypothetical protein
MFFFSSKNSSSNTCEALKKFLMNSETRLGGGGLPTGGEVDTILYGLNRFENMDIRI